MAPTALYFALLAVAGLPGGAAIVPAALSGGFGMNHGVLQPMSGRRMTRPQAHPPAEAFATRHLMFAGLLVRGAVIYAVARNNPPMARL